MPRRKKKSEKMPEAEFKPCLVCTRPFDTSEKLAQHKEDSQHNYKVGDNKQRLAYVNEYYKKSATIVKTEKKQAVQRVREVVDDIITHVRKQDGGSIYGNEVRNAGSYSTNTKVGKPDEFDLNLPLQLPGSKIVTKTSGPLDYDVHIPTDQGNKTSNLHIKSSVVAPTKDSVIKKGYASVKLKDIDDKKFQHVSHDGYVIPRKVKEDLHGKMERAVKELGYKGKVDLSPDAHGPAVTMTVKENHAHHISVDVAATIDQPNIPNPFPSFPRSATKERVPKKSTDSAEEAGAHLVPKSDSAWYISNSKAEKALLKNVDEDNGCRRGVHKMMKKDLMTWSSQHEKGLPGISTHVLKNQLLWMNEEKQGADKNYWRQENMDQCYMDALEDLSQKCRRGKIPNYFNRKENILAGKCRGHLNDMADYADARHSQLANLSQ